MKESLTTRSSNPLFDAGFFKAFGFEVGQTMPTITEARTYLRLGDATLVSLTASRMDKTLLSLTASRMDTTRAEFAKKVLVKFKVARNKFGEDVADGDKSVVSNRDKARNSVLNGLIYDGEVLADNIKNSEGETMTKKPHRDGNLHYGEHRIYDAAAYRLAQCVVDRAEEVKGNYFDNRWSFHGQPAKRLGGPDVAYGCLAREAAYTMFQDLLLRDHFYEKVKTAKYIKEAAAGQTWRVQPLLDEARVYKDAIQLPALKEKLPVITSNIIDEPSLLEKHQGKVASTRHNKVEKVGNVNF